MIVITAEWLSPNDDAPPSKKFVGGLLICLTAEDGTKDYAGLIVDENAAAVRYSAFDGDLNKEGWAAVVQRALEHPGFSAVPENWVGLMAKLVGEAQEAGCLDGRGQPRGPGPRHLNLA